MMADPFDIDGLRIDPADPAYVGKAAKSRKQRKASRTFHPGALGWLERLKGASGQAYRAGNASDLRALEGQWRAVQGCPTAVLAT